MNNINLGVPSRVEVKVHDNKKMHYPGGKKWWHYPGREKATFKERMEEKSAKESESIEWK